MTSRPDVSVVMSVHNDSRYLRRAIDSILSQEGIELELVAVDDGSTDGSAEILAQYAARDSRVRIFSQENAGLTLALIRGCREARAEFIARQDADDVSLPGRLKRQAEMLRADATLAFVSSWAEVIGPEDELLLTYTRPADPDAATHQLLVDRISPPGHGSVMFRRQCYETVGGYYPELYYAQDSDLWLRMGRVGRLGYVQDVLYRYRLSGDSISGLRHAAKLPFARLVDELNDARLTGQSEAPLLAAASALRDPARQPTRTSQDRANYFIGRCLAARRDPRALQYFVRCIRSNPVHLRAWLFLILSLVRRIGSIRRAKPNVVPV